MSVDFEALFFYGMPIDSERGWDLVETFDAPAIPLEVVNLSPMLGANYMLFVRESYNQGDKNDDERLVKLSDVTGKEAEWRQLIVDACAAHDITFVEPDWYFATTFS